MSGLFYFSAQIIKGAFQTKVEAAWCNDDGVSFLCQSIAIRGSEGLSALAASSLTTFQQLSSFTLSLQQPCCSHPHSTSLSPSLFSPLHFHFKRLYCLHVYQQPNVSTFLCSFGLHSGFSGRPAVERNLLCCHTHTLNHFEGQHR